MAFGLSPKHIQDLPLENLTTEQFLVIAIEAAKKLDWNVGYTSEMGFIAFTKFSMSSWSEEVKVKIEDGNANLKSECTGSQMMDWGKNKENIENLVATIGELKKSFTPEELVQKYDDLKSNLVSNEQDVLNQPPSTTKEKIASIFAIFKPTQGYFITSILINLNIAIFILMVIAGVSFFLPDNASLLKWGANFRPVTLEGEPWRLITSCFLHIGIFHLLMNVYALLYIGSLLEPHLGKTRFLSAYLLTGLTASIASLWWHDLTISAGASGAIFGMYGVFLAMLTTNLIEKSARKAMLTSIAVFVGYNVLNGLKPNSGIDNAAHIGGLVSGLVFGYALIPSLKKPDASNLKYGTIGILAVLILSTSFIAYKKIPNDIGFYDSKIKEFVSMEAMALEVYNLPEGTPKDKLLYGIKDRGIYYWNENIKLIDSFKELDLPLEIRTKNRLLIEYCELRIKSYQLLYKAIDEDTDQYKGQIEDYNKQIETKINELGGGQQNM
ncbi:MAG TPA: rhomboid family intramembrane serine protease [Cytophagales bacterium]|nr:rhomboid family intramembrane serine protease [Cytophagales bacterium]